ncbi:MAG: hypothetical protein ACRDOE_09125 [Streptosporangiaceae bacterium]
MDDVPRELLLRVHAKGQVTRHGGRPFPTVRNACSSRSDSL